MAIELFNDGVHRCLAFENLVSGDGIQANQFLVIHDRHTALIDPGGDLTYTPLFMEVIKHVTIKELDYVIASHQDPDIIASLDKWMTYTNCQIACSKLWSRFLPHLIPKHLEQVSKKSTDTSRYIAIPDGGMDLSLGDSVLKAVPAHFLHSVGNFHFYDPIAKILFTGDVGASIVEEGLDQPVTDFEAHLPAMEPFHRRYMANNKACRLWVNMVRNLDIEMIVPQHGRSFRGKEMINKFLDWFEGLECGLDLMDESSYQIP